ncbi:SDR family NAD(P)-dependent oxidoreductase [Nocardia puris]|uniref:2-deoxy-D-gluconate 3-dehydrogenase n=1 Tax=Nocardia puris TaxID=208602 RepID=A0A366E350_9NOCA|nr:SDR family oxidoreductase [Nocardia puris]RBO96801.1 2-deoxy-D-gluconate 3-dehydrogenase [Nocardia puris]
MFDLTDRVVLVTGATRGLGRAIATGPARLGAHVVIGGRDAGTAANIAASLRDSGSKASSIALDVTAPEARITAAIDDLVAAHGVPHGLVNSAGIISRAPATEVPVERFEAVLATNLTGIFAVTRAVGGHMLAAGRGSVVNLSSVLQQSGGRHVVAYAASKGGVAQLTRALAVEWSSAGVRVNAITAGYFATDLTGALRADPDRSAALLARIPPGRWGRPEELVGVSAFLLSDVAGYVTGATVEVDGGWTAA